METTQRISYNNEMPIKKAPTMETLPVVDVAELCRSIERLMGYNQRQMAELLGLNLRTYQLWLHEDSKRTGEAVARLFLLKEQAEKKFGIKLVIPECKPKTQQQNT